MSGTPIKARASELVILFSIINKDFDKRLQNSFFKLYKGRVSGTVSRALLDRYTSRTVSLKKADADLVEITTPRVKVKLKNSAKYTLESISKRLKEYIDARTKELENDYAKYETIYKNLYSSTKVKLITAGRPENEFKVYENNIDKILTAYRKNELVNIPTVIADANKFEKTVIEPALMGSDKAAFRNAKTIYKYIMLKVIGEGLANVIMKARIDCYSDLATSGIKLSSVINSTTKKTIIFSSYIKTCQAIFDVTTKLGYNPITVYGETTKLLTTQVQRFVNDENANPLITTYKSLSTGVPLIAANVIIMFGLPFRQYIFDQAIGRAWRTGQDKPVVVYIVELDTGEEPNITDRDFSIIDFYRKEVERITGNKADVVMDKEIAEGPIDEIKLTTESYHMGETMDIDPYYYNDRSKKDKDILDEWL